MQASKLPKNTFKLKYLGIDAYQEAVLFIRADSPYIISGIFEIKTRIIVRHANKAIIATLSTIHSNILGPDEVSLSEMLWLDLNASEQDPIELFRAELPDSLRHVRAKLYGQTLNQEAFNAVLKEVIGGLYSDVFLASFVTACAGDRLSINEILAMSRAMIESGSRLNWNQSLVMDKHCVGGLPGNRTTILVVPIIAAFGLTMPKTSSRSITSPAGTADTMEVFCPVTLKLEKMQSVVEKEGGCIVWGGTSRLSPADDIFINVERSLDIDSVGLMISSVLSKKVSAGSNHVLIDMPIGPTAKIRSENEAKRVSELFKNIGTQLGLNISVNFSDGLQPVGRGIGPALEARDVLAILRNEKDAPSDLRDRSLSLAGQLLELSGKVPKHKGEQEAKTILRSGKALSKFLAICEAQGGFTEPKKAKHQYTVTSQTAGVVTEINNRKISMAAKIAGAPRDKTAGIDYLAPLGKNIEREQPLFIIHAESEGKLQSTLDYISFNNDIVCIKTL